MLVFCKESSSKYVAEGTFNVAISLNWILPSILSQFHTVFLFSEFFYCKNTLSLVFG